MSDSVRPQRRKSTRLPHPWDSPGKNTGEDCHFLLHCMKVKSESEVAQSCPTLSDSMDCSPPGFSVHGIFQARVLEWGAIAFSNMILMYEQKKSKTEEISQKLMHLVACDRRGNGGRAETFLRTTLYSCDFWAIFMFHIFKTINKNF